MQKRFIAGLLLFSFMIGCDSVSVDKPFGELADSDFCQSLCGVWTNEDGDECEIAPAALSEVSLSVRKRRETDGKQVPNTSRLIIRRVGDLTLVFAPSGSPDDARYVMFRLLRWEDGSVSIRACNPDLFKPAVKNGSLDGTISEQKGQAPHLRLVSTQRLSELMKSPKATEYFTHQDDFRFRRKPL